MSFSGAWVWIPAQPRTGGIALNSLFLHLILGFLIHEMGILIVPIKLGYFEERMHVWSEPMCGAQ